MILAMSSELFENIFLSTEDKNPVIILHEVEAWQVECLLNYMYRGETRVSDAHFIPLCRVAKSLQIKGFDKLELYREAVKQSRKKDSPLITKTEESKNENFFSLPNPSFPRPDSSFTHPDPSFNPPDSYRDSAQPTDKDGSWNRASVCNSKPTTNTSVSEAASKNVSPPSFNSPSPPLISSPTKKKIFIPHSDYSPGKVISSH